MAFVQLGSSNSYYQVVSGYIGVGSTLPSAGGVRLDNNTGIYSRTTGGTDVSIAYVDTSGNATFGDSAQKTRIHSSTAGALEIWQSGVRRFYFSGTNFVIEAGNLYLGATQFITGIGSPESVVTAPVGSIFLRTDGGVSTTLYVKTSGAGNTGWTAK
jgi:hypothetical protein